MRPLVVSFFVFLFAFFGTGYVYQNWLENDSNLLFSDNVAYSHTSKVLTLSAPSGKRLVPVGAVLGVNDVNVIHYNFEVDIEENKSIEVLLDNVIFRNSEESFYQMEDMLLFEYHVDLVNESLANVTVSISLRMPQTELEYQIMQGSQVSLQLLFNPKP